jgi:hypothetical protein
MELFSPLQYEITKFCCGHGKDPPANGRISSRIKAAIIGLPEKGCQEIEGLCYNPQIPQMTQITISSRGLFCVICAICGFIPYLALATANFLYWVVCVGWRGFLFSPAWVFCCGVC